MEKRSRETRSYEAYQKLLDGILSCAYAPGASLSDHALSLKIGISRTPIREALFLLAMDGLVKRSVAGGFEVAKITSEDVLDLYDTRISLEGSMLRLTFQKGISLSLVDTLRYLNGNMVSSLKRGKLLSAFAFDERFHHALALASGNSRMLAFFARIEIEVKRIRLLSLEEKALEGSDEHDLVVDALERGDLHACHDALLKNLEEEKALCLSILRRNAKEALSRI